ncbi:MAG: macro domain-containing protein [Microscillaceae bacterium]
MWFKFMTLFYRLQMQVLKPFGSHFLNPKLSITICEQNKTIAEAMAQGFSDIEGVEVICGDIFKLSADVIVSPANSFGDMGGGLDKKIDDFFGGKIQPLIQQHIHENYWGEMPVGIASVLALNHQQFKHLILAPTMRIPGNVSQTLNAYLAMWAILVAANLQCLKNKNSLSKIVMTSLCTGIGGMDYVQAAFQMKTACRQVLLDEWKKVVHPVMAPFSSYKF